MSIQYGEASAVAVGSPVTPERMAMAALTKAVSTKIKRRRGLHKSIDKTVKALRSEKADLKSQDMERVADNATGKYSDTLKDKNEIHKQLNDANTELNKANLKLQGVRKAMA
ncbi:hypothetical protein OC834_007384 [Tilletia horrida]|nr:hypothetical protein OC834_007384 [Tilletia horrida]